MIGHDWTIDTGTSGPVLPGVSFCGAPNHIAFYLSSMFFLESASDVTFVHVPLLDWNNAVLFTEQMRSIEHTSSRVSTYGS